MKRKINIFGVVLVMLFAGSRLCSAAAPSPSSSVVAASPVAVAPTHDVVAAYKLIIRINPSISVLRIAEWSPGSLSRATVDVGYIDQPQIEADQQYIHLAYMKLDSRSRDTVQYKFFRNSQQLLQSYQFPLPPKIDVKSIALRLNGTEVHVAVSAVDPVTLKSAIYYFTKVSPTAPWNLQRFFVPGQLGDGLELEIVPQINYSLVAFTRQTASGRDVAVLEIDHTNRSSIQSVAAAGNIFTGSLSTYWVKPFSFHFSPYSFLTWLSYAQADPFNNPQQGVSVDEGTFGQPLNWSPKANLAGAWGAAVSYRYPSGFNVATVEGQGGLFFGGRDLYLYQSPSGSMGAPVLLDSGPLFNYPSITRQDTQGNFYIGVGAMTNPFLGIGEIRLYNPQGSYVSLEPFGGPVYFKELDIELRY